MELEDNNGGDVLSIRKVRGGLIEVELGQSCVYVFRKRMRPGVLIALLTAAYDKIGVKDSMPDYPEEFVTKLLDSVEDIYK